MIAVVFIFMFLFFITIIIDLQSAADQFMLEILRNEAANP